MNAGKVALIVVSISLFGLFSFLEVSYQANGATGARLAPLVEALPQINNPSYKEGQTALLVRPEIKEEPKKETITLGFVGDIMLDRGVRSSVDKRGGDYSYLFQKIKFPKTDILFGNLEGPVAYGGEEIGNLYSFRMHPMTLSVLKEAGFNVLSLANNHIGDWGPAAANESVNNIKDVGLSSVGWGKEDLNDALTIIEKEGIRIGYLAFSDVGPAWLPSKKDEAGVYLATQSNLETYIPLAKKEVDILVVSYHFGEEYEPESNKRQQTLARNSIDLGADLIIGHHPHVTQEIEEYNDGLIAYSLGNFIFDQYFSPETMMGRTLLVEIGPSGIHSYTPGTSFLNGTFQIEALLWDKEIVF
ncbi:hypothetical protein CL654_01850 [bacterium]|nr:hypothetical protein [bacterium]|tara:strand:+ start:8490 stop:9566 length:1077 start_codon:yes stop_codon:yes gene_type:complete